MAQKIFINYRRLDTEDATRSIFLGLKPHFSEDIFFDRDSIQGGQEWPDSIRKGLEQASIVIVVIGKTWLTLHDKAGKRLLDKQDDWVRLEIQYALDNNKILIPVLVQGALMPGGVELPPELEKLATWQAIRLTQDNWDTDFSSLLRRIANPRLKPSTIVFASKSPRRKDLLRQFGWNEMVDYYAVHASVNLSYHSATGGEASLSDCIDFAEATAHRKIDYVITHWHDLIESTGKELTKTDTIIVGVDTIVVCENQILDRPLLRALEFAGPRDIESARERAQNMLRNQRGKTIQIITSVAIALASEHRHPIVKTVVTHADLRDYSDNDIKDYLIGGKPFEQAGAMGIQDKGVALFKSIKGSYSNVVGLPLREFITLLQGNYGNKFELPVLKSDLGKNEVQYHDHVLSAFCLGDINYDFIYNNLPENFFTDLQPPGKKVYDKIERGAGGTAVNFAKGARKAGFSSCVVAGVVGGDALGQEIAEELHSLRIDPLLPSDPAQETSIAIILRNRDQKDISITLTDAKQSLPSFVVERAKDGIEKSDVFFCSGYSLIDPNRKDNAVEMLKIARNSGRIVVLDVVVGMDSSIGYDEIRKIITDERKIKSSTVLVSEFPEIFRWLDIDFNEMAEIEVWGRNKDLISNKLRQDFSVVILRTSNYTQEVVIHGNAISEPVSLDYPTLPPRKKVGYADFRTAEQVYKFLSPRIVLASKSPQRLSLLSQMVSPHKIEVRVSHCDEGRKPHETPHDRVQRLALAKAQAVHQQRDFSDTIEFIIGADTEIIVKNIGTNEWEMIGHPTTDEGAKKDLRSLSGKTHIALTGIAVIGADPSKGKLKTITEYVETKVTFAELSEHEIESYVASKEPIGRAGAYAIQGLGVQLIESIEGSYSNVVGLPLERLSEILSVHFDRPIWMFDKVSGWSFPRPIKQAIKDE